MLKFIEMHWFYGRAALQEVILFGLRLHLQGIPENEREADPASLRDSAGVFDPGVKPPSRRLNY
jgi:hypothetical protein